MKASELRLGNYIEDIFNLEKKVKRKIDLEDLAMFINYGGVRLPFKPIEITEEIKIMLHENNHIAFENDIVIIFTNNQDLYLKNNYKYLHQLQNLYFELTNEELEIQL